MPDSSIGAGMCEFVNHIRARERWAVDSDPQVARRAAPGVETHCGPAHDLGWLATDSVDVVFASNVFEQFRSTEDLLAVLREVRSVLRPGGRLLVLQPNIRFAYREYLRGRVRPLHDRHPQPPDPRLHVYLHHNIFGRAPLFLSGIGAAWLWRREGATLRSRLATAG